jgi:hypothetical protein
MDDNAKRIFDASNKIISKLQLLSVFFEDEVIFKIFIRSQVIHKLFETTPELDINKLELYHLQFTESIVELLRKIKKTNEKNVTLLFDEIQFNDILIEKFKHELEVAESYEADQHRQAVRINESIFRLYQNLSDYARDNPFPQSIYQFSAKYSKEHFHEIADALLEEVTQYTLEEEYKNGYGIIDKKLMGLQCKHDFKNVFVCGLKAGEDVLEIYKMEARDTYFLFYPRRNFYNDFDIRKIAHLDLNTPQSSKAKMVQELKEKSRQLEASEDKVRTHIAAEIKELLNTYFNRISELNFLDTSDHEVQANILRAMLNTDSL